jgi:hypothetical protein
MVPEPSLHEHSESYLAFTTLQARLYVGRHIMIIEKRTP